MHYYCLDEVHINFLTEAVPVLKSVDYGRMAEILVQRATSSDEFTRLTAITWVKYIYTRDARHSPLSDDE